MRENKNFSNIFSFRENFGNVKWTALVIEILEKQGITNVSDNMVYIANKQDGQCRYRDEIRAAIEVVHSNLTKAKADRIEGIKAHQATALV